MTAPENLFNAAMPAISNTGAVVNSPGELPPENSLPIHNVDIPQAQGSGPVDKDLSETPPEWFLAPGVPGTGDKPEFFIDSKYKTLMDQAQALVALRKDHSRLQQKVGSEPPPEMYDLDLGRIDDKYKDVKFSEKDPGMAQFVELAKEMGMKQEHVDKLLTYKVEMDNAQKQAEDQLINDYFKDELKKLGPSADVRLKSLQVWWEQNFTKFPFAKMASLGMSADFINMLETVKDKFKYNPVPTESAPPPSISAAELRQMIGDERYKTDMDYRKSVNDLYSQLYGKK